MSDTQQSAGGGTNEEKLAAIRALHAPFSMTPNYQLCRACDELWPCETIEILNAPSPHSFTPYRDAVEDFFVSLGHANTAHVLADRILALVGLEPGQPGENGGERAGLAGRGKSGVPAVAPVHRITGDCSCPLGRDHTIQDLEAAYPGLVAQMSAAALAGRGECQVIDRNVRQEVARSTVPAEYLRAHPVWKPLPEDDPALESGE